MSKPPQRSFDYEKLSCDDFITGEIVKIEEEQDHAFTYKGETKNGPGVRIVFKLEGYEFEHKSRWMKFTYVEKSNLYKKYLLSLVEGAKPDMDFDIQELQGMKVKTLWKADIKPDGKVFQEIDTIRPIGIKLKPTTQESHASIVEDEDIPF